MKNKKVYALVCKSDGEIFKNKFYTRKPSPKWLYNSQDWQVVIYELKEIGRE